MNILKITPLLVFAIFIDLFQFLVALSLSVVGAMPGTIAGCVIGNEVAGTAGCAALGLLGTIPVVNGALAVVTEPVGMIVGFVISLCISFTLGSMLVLFLKLTGMFDGKSVVLAYIGEGLPGFNALPAWTALVVRCAMKKTKQEVLGKTLGKVASLGASLVLPPTPIGSAVRLGNAAGMRYAAAPYMRTTEEGLSEESQSQPSAVRSLPMQDIKYRNRGSVEENIPSLPPGKADDILKERTYAI